MEQNDKEDTFLARWLNNDLKEKEREAFEKTKEFKEYSKIIEKLEQFQAPNFEKEELFKRIQAKVNPKGKVRSLTLAPFKLFYSESVASSLCT